MTEKKFTLWVRYKREVCTDPQRRYYDGAWARSEMRWTEWTDLYLIEAQLRRWIKYSHGSVLEFQRMYRTISLSIGPGEDYMALAMWFKKYNSPRTCILVLDEQEAKTQRIVYDKEVYSLSGLGDSRSLGESHVIIVGASQWNRRDLAKAYRRFNQDALFILLG